MLGESDNFRDNAISAMSRRQKLLGVVNCSGIVAGRVVVLKFGVRQDKEYIYMIVTAVIAQLGEHQTEDLGSVPGRGSNGSKIFFHFCLLLPAEIRIRRMGDLSVVVLTTKSHVIKIR